MEDIRLSRYDMVATAMLVGSLTENSQGMVVADPEEQVP